MARNDSPELLALIVGAMVAGFLYSLADKFVMQQTVDSGWLAAQQIARELAAENDERGKRWAREHPYTPPPPPPKNAKKTRTPDAEKCQNAEPAAPFVRFPVHQDKRQTRSPRAFDVGAITRDVLQRWVENREVPFSEMEEVPQIRFVR